MVYKEIAKILGLDEVKDKKAAKILNEILPEPNFNILEKIIAGKDVIVFGAGPSLKEDIMNIKSKKLHKELKIIAADGAVKALIEEKIFPDILVTDLDGDEKSILKANKHGTITLIHAHSDNILKIKKIVPKLKKDNILGTTQCEEFGKLKNFGGFTDGDRAVFLAEHFNAKLIILAGMDFGEKIGKYSGEFIRERKLKKLKIGKKLIENLAKKSKVVILNITKKGEYLVAVPKISIEDLATLLGF
ncbi:hypothetical protein DRN73_08505 [Candidatus Pacearchaeota archaeon]|nr:MAG: hypothetical protein DRN73_08505 [Candidatus Pacearchaeota archaeon]